MPRHDRPAIDPVRAIDPARFLPARGLRAYASLLAAQYRNFRRTWILRRGRCPECRLPLEPASLSPVLFGHACPAGHCFVVRVRREPQEADT